MEAVWDRAKTCEVFTLMIPKIVHQKVEISPTLKTCDMSDIHLALVVLVSAVKNKQTNFSAFI